MDISRLLAWRDIDALPDRARIFFKQIYGFSKGLDERGVTVEKAVPRSDDGGCDFGNAMPKITTYYSAKRLTFDSVLLPRLTESSFSWFDEATRLRLLFVGIARATQWVYLSTVQGREFSEIKTIRDAEKKGHLTLQRTYDYGQNEKIRRNGESLDDEFSLL
jgi:superfamily I DNA/RNA helicase